MQTQDSVLVYGASGHQGRPILRELMAAGHRPVALTRTGDTVLPDGATRVVGDMNDLASLIGAQEGIPFTIVILPLVFDREIVERYMRNVIDAARAAGVRRLVFDTSVPVPDRPVGVAALDVKVAAAELLAESGLDAVTIRPTIYAGNLAAPWAAPGIVHDKLVAYPLAAHVACSWISWEDSARAVVASLGRADLSGRSIDIGGPEALNGGQIAEAFDHARGAGHRYAAIPVDAFEAGLAPAIGADAAKAIAELYRFLSGDGADMLRVGDDWQQLLDVRPRSMSEWIEGVPWPQLVEGAVK